MKKKKILFIIPIFGLIFISIVFFCDYTGMFKTNPDEQYAYKTVRTIQNEWKIQIDGSPELIDYKISDMSFRGDSEKFFVLKLKNENQIQTIKMNRIQDTDLENAFIQATQSGKGYDKMPDFTQEYTWKKIDKDNDSLFIIYSPQELKLYLLESRI